jgi:hypothetical protein
VTFAARLCEIGQAKAALALDGSGEPLNRLVYAQSLLSAGLALSRWMEATRVSGRSDEGLSGVLVDAVRRDGREAVVEWIEALAWFGICQAARSMAAADRERLVADAFPALGWVREPTRDEENIVSTLVQSALLEEPEVRWGPFFVAVCELTGNADQDIDDWMLLGNHVGLLEAVRVTWDERGTGSPP